MAILETEKEEEGGRNYYRHPEGGKAAEEGEGVGTMNTAMIN